MRNVGGKFHPSEFDKVKNENNSIYYTYILFSKTKTLQENIDWSNIQPETNIPIFVPPIYYGKVLKVYTGDTFVLATKLPFLEETAQIYKFTIRLDGVSASIDKVLGGISKKALIQKIGDQVVQLRDISTDRHGKIYAKVFLAEENVNEWLLKNQYVVRSKNGKKRRMSESDSVLSVPSAPYYSCKDIIPENANTNTLSIDNFILPSIQIQRQNTNLSTASSSSSSSIKTDCFLSHNWGDQNKNHAFVKKVNLELQNRGLKTWFDENQMDGNIRFRMAEGIDNTKCVVVFITKEYRDKVNGIDMTDNCKYEFSYAMNQLGSQNMIPVVLEAEMRDTKKWKGELGAALGSMMYVDLSLTKDQKEETMLELKYEDISRKIRKMVEREKRKSNK